jgi:protein TonB
MKVHVSSGVSQGLLLSKVNPIYPDDARRKGIQGVVVLKATIGQDGSIGDLQVVSGAQELVPAAVEAVRQWRYKPLLYMGIPVEAETQIQVNFTLSR